MKKCNEVKVIFENPKDNYTTSVSPDATYNSCKKYFVGRILNIGIFPKDNLKKCIDIEFTDNNIYEQAQ